MKIYISFSLARKKIEKSNKSEIRTKKVIEI
jgi:hypothetical protein